MTSISDSTRVHRMPVVAKANYYQFARGEKLEIPPAESRMLLWCGRGEGELNIENLNVKLFPGIAALLPWKKRRIYQSCKTHPMHVGGVHLIPNHLPGYEVEYAVARGADHHLTDCPYRQDSDIKGKRELSVFKITEDHELIHLAIFIVKYFEKTSPPENFARSMADLLVHCVEMRTDNSDKLCDGAPVQLRQVVDYVENHLNFPIHIDDLVEIASCSRSTLNRYFRKHLNVSANEWIIRKKLKKAQTLLKTTNLSISEVSEKIGIYDQFYFSQLFKKRTGLAPKRYREFKQLL